MAGTGLLDSTERLTGLLLAESEYPRIYLRVSFFLDSDYTCGCWLLVAVRDPWICACSSHLTREIGHLSRLGLMGSATSDSVPFTVRHVEQMLR